MFLNGSGMAFDKALPVVLLTLFYFFIFENREFYDFVNVA